MIPHPLKQDPPPPVTLTYVMVDVPGERTAPSKTLPGSAFPPAPRFPPRHPSELAEPTHTVLDADPKRRTTIFSLQTCGAGKSWVGIFTHGFPHFYFYLDWTVLAGHLQVVGWVVR